MRWLSSILLSGFVAASVSATEVHGLAMPPGLCADMAYSEESGDVDGIELRVVHHVNHDFVEFSVGTGGCGEMQVEPLTRDGKRWRFVYSEQLGQSAADGSFRITETHRYTLWLSTDGRGLRLQSDPKAADADWLAGQPNGRYVRPIRRARCLGGAQR